MGMIGGGEGAFIGGVHRMAAALDQEIALVAGCFSRYPENTRRTGAKLGLDPRRCYPTAEAMAAAEAALPPGERIDFVAIVTPNRAHLPGARTFLEHGFHVLCDKPLTAALAEARTLAEVVERTGLVFGLTHNYSGYPLVRHARELFRSGELGAVRKIVVEYLQDFLAYPHEQHGHKQALWRVDPAHAGDSGTLSDCGSHALHLLEYVTGEQVTSLCADPSTFLPGRVLEEDINILLRLRGGGRGTMVVSQIAIGEENALSLRVYAERGSIKWAKENPNFLELYRYKEPRQMLTRGSSYLSEPAARATRIPVGHPEGYLEAFATLYRDFAAAVRAFQAGERWTSERFRFPTIHDGVRGLEFIDAALRSGREGGRWEAISPGASVTHLK
jgi:predicted dehydrogenase